MGPHSAAVHQMLTHLDRVGFVGAPRVLRVDPVAQTETLTFLEGEVANYPPPPNFTAERAMISAAQLLRRLLDAMDTFTITEIAKWWLPRVEPVQTVVHGDFAPYNCVIRNGDVVGVFDFDTAHPAPRIWDVGYAAYRWVPLVAPTNPDRFGTEDDQIRRFPQFCAAYGVRDLSDVIDSARQRLITMVETIRKFAAAGNTAFQQHLNDGHDELYLQDAAYLATNRARFTGS